MTKKTKRCISTIATSSSVGLVAGSVAGSVILPVGGTTIGAIVGTLGGVGTGILVESELSKNEKNKYPKNIRDFLSRPNVKRAFNLDNLRINQIYKTLKKKDAKLVHEIKDEIKRIANEMGLISKEKYEIKTPNNTENLFS